MNWAVLQAPGPQALPHVGEVDPTFQDRAGSSSFQAARLEVAEKAEGLPLALAPTGSLHSLPGEAANGAGYTLEVLLQVCLAEGPEELRPQAAVGEVAAGAAPPCFPQVLLSPWLVRGL